jgi:hypothetical protein
MLRAIVLLAFLVSALAPTAGSAQSRPAPSPSAHAYKHAAMLHSAKPLTFTNPAQRSNATGTRSGAGCIAAGPAQTAINPITGKPQAAPAVEVPVSAGAGSVASATTHAQQTQACAQGR